MNAIVPLVDFKNRRERRVYVREAGNIVVDLEKVNTSFIYELFDDQLTDSYSAIYERHLNMWKETVAELIKTHKFTSCAIDRLWFANNYQPKPYI